MVTFRCGRVIPTTLGFTPRLFNTNSFVGSAALAEVCALLGVVIWSLSDHCTSVVSNRAGNVLEYFVMYMRIYVCKYVTMSAKLNRNSLTD